MKYRLEGKTFKVYFVVEEINGLPSLVPLYKDRLDKKAFVCYKADTDQFMFLNDRQDYLDAQKNTSLELVDVRDAENKFPNRVKLEWAEFERWNWKTYTMIASKGAITDAQGRPATDFIRLREEKLRRLLVDWSLADDGKKIVLERVNSRLTDKSFSDVTSISPTILSHITSLADNILEFSQEEYDFFTSPTSDVSQPQAESK